ncbi:MAG: DNA gyrase subunit A [Acidobacteriota bacterium]|nr:DNA gyrase subunit A [Acidobacteriota bacterium]
MADETNNPLLPLDGGGGPPQNIQPINIEEEMRRSYLDYSMSVIIGRALPDIRDGMKPVHRRILYAMYDMGLLHNRKHVKCAKVVGEVLGKYHPHGDSSVYDALVRMAQFFRLRYPLVDGQGNFGSVDGDPPAAYRYTEARLMKITAELLADIDLDTVDFSANFDDSTVEPTVLPTRIPTLLVNGSNGIAVGMATNIPPHNLTEILTAAIELVEKPTTTLDRILEIVQGPDFPTGGFIHGRSGIKEAYRTGRGRFMMRAKVAIEHMTKDRDAIIVTEIPYEVNKRTLIERVADLVNNKVIEDISDIRDESDRDGMRIVIELKRGTQAEIVLNQLYKHTSMQESFSMIFLAVMNGQPRELGLLQALQAFIDHRIDVVRRRTAFLLQKAKDREHILEGYQKALDYLDHVIAIIRGSANRADARDNLVAYFGGKKIAINLTGKFPTPDAERPFSTRQADAILELQLHRLTRLSIDEIVSELQEQRSRIAEYELILSSDKKLKSVIVDEFKELLKEYGGPTKDPRRTIIQEEAKELQIEDLIADEQVAVTVSHAGYLKRTAVSTYRAQRRGGTGRKGMSTREEDFVEHMIAASTHNFILNFTNTGRVYWLKVYEIPDVAAAGKGKHIGNLVSLQPGEAVRAFLNVRDLEEDGKYIFFATRNGTVKKTPLKDFSNVMSRGIIAISIEKDDELVYAGITNGNQTIFLATHDGMAIRFDEAYDSERSGAGLRPMGRNAGGNRGITLKKGDYVIGAAITGSYVMRDQEREERAAGVGQTAKLASLRKAHDEAEAALTQARLDSREKGLSPEAVKAAEKKVEDCRKALKHFDEKLGIVPQLILTVTENGYGKRTDVDEYRLTSRGAQGVINMKTTPKVGKVVSILLVTETTQMMAISQYGKIIRTDTDTIREAGRGTQGVKLLHLDNDDHVAAAVVLPNEESNGNGDEEPSLLNE